MTIQFATSADGTRIAYEITASSRPGPVVVIVEGALCQRSMGTTKTIAPALSETFSVVGYDRRGRGESDAGPDGVAAAYDVQREVEDLVAVLDAVSTDSERPYVFAASSGAVLALEAARQGVPMRKLATYEAPFILDGTHPANSLDLPAHLQAMIDQGRRGDAVKTFMRTVGVPGFGIVMMRLMPVWKKLTQIAHTLPYDLSIVVPFEQGAPLPVGYYAGVAPETLVIAGGKSPAYLQNAQAAIAGQLPAGRLLTLPGQVHMIKAKATVPVLVEHFS
jgi:pimeloyl-ACP methyl ester carboxylesterase